MNRDLLVRIKQQQIWDYTVLFFCKFIFIQLLAQSDDTVKIKLREDTRLTKDLWDHLATYDAINIDECKKTDDDLTKCLSDVIGDDDTERLSTTDQQNIHTLADMVDKVCDHKTGVVTCVKTAMTKKIKCVRDNGKTVDESILTRGMRNMESLMDEHCLEATKTTIKDVSKKVKDCVDKGHTGLNKCLREKAIAGRILYGEELDSMLFIDKTKCYILKNYKECLLKEWELCDIDKVDDDLKDKTKTGLTNIEKTIGCEKTSTLDINIIDKRFHHLVQMEICKKSLGDDDKNTILAKCTRMTNDLKDLLTDMRNDIHNDNPTGEWVDKYCKKLNVVEECFIEKMDMVKKCLRDDESIFKRDGIKPVKKILENLCKNNGVEIKSKRLFLIIILYL